MESGGSFGDWVVRNNRHGNDMPELIRHLVGQIKALDLLFPGFSKVLIEKLMK